MNENRDERRRKQEEIKQNRARKEKMNKEAGIKWDLKVQDAIEQEKASIGPGEEVNYGLANICSTLHHMMKRSMSMLGKDLFLIPNRLMVKLTV